MAAEKSNVRYDPELRRQARDARLGLVTVHVRFPDGREHQVQVSATPDECKFVTWAAALVQHREIRPVPDLEELVRVHLDASGIPPITENLESKGESV